MLPYYKENVPGHMEKADQGQAQSRKLRSTSSAWLQACYTIGLMDQLWFVTRNVCLQYSCVEKNSETRSFFTQQSSNEVTGWWSMTDAWEQNCQHTCWDFEGLVRIHGGFPYSKYAKGSLGLPFLSKPQNHYHPKEVKHGRVRLALACVLTNPWSFLFVFNC